MSRSSPEHATRTHSVSLGMCARVLREGTGTASDCVLLDKWTIKVRQKFTKGAVVILRCGDKTRARTSEIVRSRDQRGTGSCGRRSPHDPGKMITKRVLYTEGDWVERGEPDGTRSVFVVRCRASPLRSRPV